MKDNYVKAEYINRDYGLNGIAIRIYPNGASGIYDVEKKEFKAIN